LPWAGVYSPFRAQNISRLAAAVARAESPLYPSPGQRPGLLTTPISCALKGQHNPAQGLRVGYSKNNKNNIMSQSLSKLYVHVIFHIKDERVFIRPEDETELYAYIGGIIRKYDSSPIKINGTENHVHTLSTLSKNMSLAGFIEEIKKSSSHWIKTKGFHYKHFAWQGGYAGYSVSQSKLVIVEQYIEKQKEHHRTVSFREEYLRFLKEYGIDFNETWLWR
jgi:REP element-mobilizing transposase RayT